VALKRRSLTADIKALAWPLVFLALTIAATVAFYLGTQTYWDSILREESGVYGELNFVSSQVSAIEDAERTFIENIDRFNIMVANGVLNTEDRVALLAEIGRIRNNYKLFPLNVSVSEQESRMLEFPLSEDVPEENMSLRVSRVEVGLPLLHEEDLTRLLSDLLSPQRMLLANRCEINRLSITEDEALAVVPHQRASCEFHWYTLQRESIVQEDYYSE